MPLVARLTAHALPKLAGPIARRTINGIPQACIRSSILPNLATPAKLIMHEERVFALADEILAYLNRIRGLGGADIVVNYQGNGGSFLDYAKQKGAKIVTDFIITPKHLEIEQQERTSWPGWEVETTPTAILDFFARRMAHLVGLSDMYLCPSATVARDLSALPGFDHSRVRLLPYGNSGVMLSKARPECGRVLFAGAAGLRKGIPYLAEAARRLKTKRPDIEIVIAGAVSPAIRARTETCALTFLGPLGRKRMADEFACADIYCLPSLAEGSATSIFEALANGLPVVTTASSGSVVHDGIEGFIIPERNSQAIADAIEHIVDDRRLRAAMSGAALAAAARFSDDACGKAFVAAIAECFGLQEAH